MVFKFPNVKSRIFLLSIIFWSWLFTLYGVFHDGGGGWLYVPTDIVTINGHSLKFFRII
jgi:hypothetical protein